MKFDCPACGKTLNVKDEMAGKKGKCPNCGAKVTVPSAETPDDENWMVAELSEDGDDEYKVAEVPESAAGQQPTHLSADTLKQS